MISRLSLVIFLTFALPTFAAIQHDLGQGLHYVRVTDLTKDSSEVQTALAQEAVVLDLRNTVASPDSAAALALKLDQPPPGDHGVRILLINPGTAAPLVEALSHPHPRELTIGPRTPALLPDIAVAITPDDDRKAYEALPNGVPIDKLLSSNPEKRRFDEAALARNHANGGTDAESDHDETPETAPTTKSNTPPEAAPPVVPHDLVLGRAVQLHRALAAAKK